MMRRLTTLALVAGALLAPAVVAEEAQSLVAPAEAPAEEPDLASLGAECPRGAIRLFLDAGRARDFDRAAEFLAIDSPASDERAMSKADLARRLKIVLDRTIWIDYAQLSADPLGAQDDDLPPDVDRIATLHPPRMPLVDVLMNRSESEDGSVAWRFTPSTVARIPALYDVYGYGPIGDILPERMFLIRFLEIELWQWIGLIVIVLVAFPLAGLLTWLLHCAVKPIARRTRTPLDDRLLELTATPLRFAVALAVFSVGVMFLRLAIPALEVVKGIETGLAVFAAAWMLFRAVDVVAALVKERLEAEDRRSAVAALPLLERTAKVVLMILAVIALLQNVGFNVTGLIAGLGVGGLALALAAQKTLENLFGGVSLILDQPVRVGDFGRFGETLGTVEDVGLRSTRIRTLDRTVVSVPNADFAQARLENFGRRDKLRLYARLGLRYETTPDQLRLMLTELRRLLKAHPRIDPDPARARFIQYGDWSLDIEIFAYVQTMDNNEFLAIQEDILLRIADIVTEAGTGFAFPSQTTYLGRDTGIDDEAARRAERRIREWRAAGQLPFPDFTPEAIAQMNDSLDYPPDGSASLPR